MMEKADESKHVSLGVVDKALGRMLYKKPGYEHEHKHEYLEKDKKGKDKKELKEIECPKCGRKLPVLANFCDKCGHKLKG